MKISKYILLSIYIITILLICLLSLQTSVESSDNSGKISEILYKMLNVITFNKINFDYNLFHTFVRKAIGHFGLNMVSGIFGLLTYFSFKVSLRKSLLITILFGLLVAIVGELMQLISFGRSCEIKDMIINYSGCLTGAGLVYLIMHAIQRKTHYRELT